MAERLDELATIDYKANVAFRLNQKPGILYPLSGASGTHVGPSSQLEDQFDDLYLKDKTTRNGDTNNSELKSKRRWVRKPASANDAPLKDRDDQLETKVDIDSALVTQTSKAVKRYHDDKWLEGYYGNAYVGEYGDIAVPFDTNNVLPHGSSGLSYDKLAAAVRMMELNDVDLEEEAPILLVTPWQAEEIRKWPEYKNADYMPGYPILKGNLKSLLNVRFVQANLGSTRAYDRSSGLTKTGTTRKLPFFVPSGMYRGVWTEFWGKITERDDKQHSKQFYFEACSTSTRLMEEKCFIVECTEPS